MIPLHSFLENFREKYEVVFSFTEAFVIELKMRFRMLLIVTKCLLLFSSVKYSTFVFCFATSNYCEVFQAVVISSVIFLSWVLQKIFILRGPAAC